MKTKDIMPFDVKGWLILGGKLVTRILQDTDKGISQDGAGTKFPKYSDDYEAKKKAGKAGPKGVTGVMLNSLKAQKPTSSSVELNYRDGLKFEGNAKRKRNVYGLNDKNFEFVKEFFRDELDNRIIKFSRKDIVIDLKV